MVLDADQFSPGNDAYITYLYCEEKNLLLDMCSTKVTWAVEAFCKLEPGSVFLRYDTEVLHSNTVHILLV